MLSQTLGIVDILGSMALRITWVLCPNCSSNYIGCKCVNEFGEEQRQLCHI